jgi:endonuclease/exonuclease/phosphatase family metal-dependent hydrolase
MTMSSPDGKFRITTYNIHKCRGVDMKFAPQRIVSVLRELDADVLCLQEVVNIPDATGITLPGPFETAERIFDQAGEIARAFPDYAVAFGENRPFRSGMYGNMTLTRLPLMRWKNYDVSRRGRERRGILETELEADGCVRIHVFNVHLGTGHMERRYQGRLLVHGPILTRPDVNGPRLVIGDFNEWTRGLTTRLMRTRFQTFRPLYAGRFPRTYPGLLPLLSLDHCYYEPPLYLEATTLWRSRTALIASDHLPLIADFRLEAQQAPERHPTETLP